MLLRFPVEQHVRTFGIVVRNAKRQRPRALQTVSFRGFFFQREILFDLAAHFVRPPRRVLFHRRFKRFEAHRRIVKMRNGDKQTFHGIIREIFLKFAERLTRFFHHKRRRDQKRHRIVDKPTAPPESALFVDIIIFAARSLLIMQHVPLRRNPRRFDLRTDIFGDGNNVIHHLYGIFENISIHAL